MLKNNDVVFKFYPLLLSLIPNYIDCLGLLKYFENQIEEK